MTNWLSEEESLQLLRGLFPDGLGGDDIMRVLCPESWMVCPLRMAFHPTPEQQYEEALQWRKNMKRMSRMLNKRRPEPQVTEECKGEKDLASLEPLPDRETFLAGAHAASGEQKETDAEELGHLVGLCLWDVLSDNHDLILPDGSVKHLGFFRATAGIIADFFYGSQDGSEDEWEFSMDCCEFYMGTWAVAGRTDLGPVYRLIFERLKALDYPWQFAFPRLGLVRLGKADPPKGSMEWEVYDPGAALAHEEEERRKEDELCKLEADMEKAHSEALKKAKNQPPPQTVVTYLEVFGHWPAGWPPWE